MSVSNFACIQIVDALDTTSWMATSDAEAPSEHGGMVAAAAPNLSEEEFRQLDHVDDIESDDDRDDDDAMHDALEGSYSPEAEADASVESGDIAGGDETTKGRAPFVSPQMQSAIDTKLHPSLSISVFDHFIMIISFASRFGLSRDGVDALCRMIRLHLPDVSIGQSCSSHYMLHQFFSHSSVHSKVFFCVHCWHTMDKCASSCPECGKAEISFFLRVGVLEELKDLLRNRSLFDSLYDPWGETDATRAGDVYEFSGYQRILSGLSRDIPEGHQPLRPLTFGLNTDGVDLSKSSKVTLWPMFLALLELPLHLRYRPENLLLVGVYVGEQEPSLEHFLGSILSDLNKEKVTLDLHGQTFSISGLFAVEDLPAKAATHFCKHGGEFGCTKCYIKGGPLTSTRPTKQKDSDGRLHTVTSNVWRYPQPPDGAQDPPIRTEESIRAYGDAAHCLQRRKLTGGTQLYEVNGHWGKQPLRVVSSLSLGRGNIIDGMHVGGNVHDTSTGPILGNCPDQPSGFILSEEVKLAVTRRVLHDLIVVTEFSRIPRPWKHVARWKTHEKKNNLLYLYPVTMRDVTPAPIHALFCMIATLFYWVSMRNGWNGDIYLKARALVRDIVRFGAPFLGGNSFWTLNTHSLTHLPDDVEEVGPTWVSSLYHFENANGVLRHLAKGSWAADRVLNQVRENLVTSRVVRQASSGGSEHLAGPATFEFLHSLSPSFRVTPDVQLGPQLFALPPIDVQSPSSTTDSVALLFHAHREASLQAMVGLECRRFSRLRVGGMLLISAAFPRKSKKRDDSFVALTGGVGSRDATHGRILDFFVVGSTAVFAVVQLCVPLPLDLLPPSVLGGASSSLEDLRALETRYLLHRESLLPHVCRVRDVLGEVIVLPVALLGVKCVLCHDRSSASIFLIKIANFIEEL